MQSELIDSRLVLPNADRECKSCRKKIEQDCEGHFGHIVLPTPIYHPNYVHEIVRILNRICLKCFELMTKEGENKRKARGTVKENKRRINSPNTRLSGDNVD